MSENASPPKTRNNSLALWKATRLCEFRSLFDENTTWCTGAFADVKCYKRDGTTQCSWDGIGHNDECSGVLTDAHKFMCLSAMYYLNWHMSWITRHWQDPYRHCTARVFSVLTITPYSWAWLTSVLKPWIYVNSDRRSERYSVTVWWGSQAIHMVRDIFGIRLWSLGFPIWKSREKVFCRKRNCHGALCVPSDKINFFRSFYDSISGWLCSGTF